MSRVNYYNPFRCYKTTHNVKKDSQESLTMNSQESLMN